MGELIYLTGPVRSGKSRRAVELARAWGPDVVFVATYRRGADDGEMTERVRRHRAERPAWRTVEAPRSIAEALAELQPRPSGVIVDCLTLWVSDRMDQSDEAILSRWNGELAWLAQQSYPAVIVGNEVGWSLVPEEPALRRFRDLTGSIGQQTAAAADEAWLMVAGCGVRLK